MIKELVFIGSEAEGYYSGAYECEGVFLSKDIYEKHEELLKDTFRGRYFYELDGKHSEVAGDLIVINIDNESDIFGIIFDKEANYESYVLEEYIEDDEECKGELVEHVSRVYETIQRTKELYSQYSFALTEEENEKVTEYVSKLREGR